MAYVFLLKNYGSNKSSYKGIDLDLNQIFEKFMTSVKEEPATSVIALNLLSEILYLDSKKAKVIVEKFSQIQHFHLIY